jgi:hypothetical protein
MTTYPAAAYSFDSSIWRIRQNATDVTDLRRCAASLQQSPRPADRADHHEGQQ